MTDISGALAMLMEDKHCSSAHAFYLLGGNYDEPVDKSLSVLQPVPRKTNRKQHKLGTGDRGRKSVYAHSP